MEHCGAAASLEMARLPCVVLLASSGRHGPVRYMAPIDQVLSTVAGSMTDGVRWFSSGVRDRTRQGGKWVVLNQQQRSVLGAAGVVSSLERLFDVDG